LRARRQSDGCSRCLGLPAELARLTLGGGTHPLMNLLLANVIFLVIHTVMDAGPAILVVMPILLPSLPGLGIDPLQLGITVVINSGIGMILPPLGILSYLTATIAGVKVETVSRAVLPFAAVLLLDLLLVAVLPILIVR